MKQAPFMVLIGATMPSVLAEIAFITNADEASPAQDGEIPPADRRGAVRGVLRYQQSLKTVPAVALR